MVFAPTLSDELLGKIQTADRARAAFEFQRSARAFPLGIPELDDILPDRGLQYGDVVELRAHGASGAATSFALTACRAAQYRIAAGASAAGANEEALTEPEYIGARREAWRARCGASGAERRVRVLESTQNWCAFVDPSGTLFAPGAARLGVDLGRLLVVRPDFRSIDRVAVRIAEAKLVSVLVIDLRGALGDVSFDARRWQRTIRKLSLVIKQLSTCVLLLTDARDARVMPLPVALRLELTRISPAAIEVRIGKERSGRIAPPRAIEWSAFSPALGAPAA